MIPAGVILCMVGHLCSINFPVLNGTSSVRLLEVHSNGSTSEVCALDVSRAAAGQDGGFSPRGFEGVALRWSPTVFGGKRSKGAVGSVWVEFKTNASWSSSQYQVRGLGPEGDRPLRTDVVVFREYSTPNSFSLQVAHDGRAEFSASGVFPAPTKLKLFWRRGSKEIPVRTVHGPKAVPYLTEGGLPRYTVVWSGQFPINADHSTDRAVVELCVLDVCSKVTSTIPDVQWFDLVMIGLYTGVPLVLVCLLFLLIWDYELALRWAAKVA